MGLSDLTSKTRAELNEMTKDQLIAAIMEGETYIEFMREVTQSGDLKRLEEVTRDVFSGDMLGSRIISWSYYDGGEVDEIGTQHLSAGGKETERQEIKHFLDGRQPQMSTYRSAVGKIL